MLGWRLLVTCLGCFTPSAPLTPYILCHLANSASPVYIPSTDIKFDSVESAATLSYLCYSNLSKNPQNGTVPAVSDFSAQILEIMGDEELCRDTLNTREQRLGLKNAGINAYSNSADSKEHSKLSNTDSKEVVAGPGTVPERGLPTPSGALAQPSGSTGSYFGGFISPRAQRELASRQKSPSDQSSTAKRKTTLFAASNSTDNLGGALHSASPSRKENAISPSNADAAHLARAKRKASRMARRMRSASLGGLQQLNRLRESAGSAIGLGTHPSQSNGKEQVLFSPENKSTNVTIAGTTRHQAKIRAPSVQVAAPPSSSVGQQSAGLASPPASKPHPSSSTQPSSSKPSAPVPPPLPPSSLSFPTASIDAVTNSSSSVRPPRRKPPPRNPNSLAAPPPPSGNPPSYRPVAPPLRSKQELSRAPSTSSPSPSVSSSSVPSSSTSPSSSLSCPTIPAAPSIPTAPSIPALGSLLLSSSSPASSSAPVPMKAAAPVAPVRRRQGSYMPNETLLSGLASVKLKKVDPAEIRRQHAADVAAQVGSGNMSSLIAKLREQVAGGEDDEDSDDTEDDWDE